MDGILADGTIIENYNAYASEAGRLVLHNAPEPAAWTLACVAGFALSSGSVDMDVQSSAKIDRFLTLTAPEIVARLREGEILDEWPDGWWHDDRVIAAHHLLWREAIAATPPCPDDCAGRGIVICGGGLKYFPGAWVTIRLLRHFGCPLPIELWHLGRHEVDRSTEELVARWNTTCVNAAERRNRHPSRILRGWELKPYALLHTQFREVLLLDADNCPTADPTYLFDEPNYLATGAVFWPDYGRIGPERSLWKITGVAYRDEPECETGQILIDKRIIWPGLWLAMAFNEHSDFYYQHTMGDKDSFHLAFRRLGIEYAMPNTPVFNLSGCVMCQHDFEGRRLFQHRNLDKWRLAGDNVCLDDFWDEQLCRDFLAELRSC